MSSCQSIQDDCLTLLLAFKEGGDLTFKAFCRNWRKCQFQYLFYGFRTVHDQLNFTEKLISVIKDILMKAEKLSLQVGCLYLFYAIYQKQPMQNFIKMRITPTDCDKLYELVVLLKSRPSLCEALMVYMKLWSQNAFKFVATNKEILNVQLGHSQAQITAAAEKFEALNLRVEIEDIFDEEEGIVAGLQLLEGAYNDMKLNLVENDDNLAPSNICSKIQSNLNNIASILNRTSRLEGDQSIPQPPITARQRIINKISDIRRSKSTIKVTTAAGPSRKKRKVVVCLEEDDGEKISYMPIFKGHYEKRSYAEKVMEQK